MTRAAEHSRTVDAVTLGEAMQLLVAEPGTPLQRASQFRSSIAGAETNVAVGLARQGFRVRWLGRVGDDPPGQWVLRRLRADGVDLSAVEIDTTRATGLLMRDSCASRPITVHYLRANSAATALTGSFVRTYGLSGAKVVHVTGITAMLSVSARDAVDTVFELAHDCGTLISFDPNVRLKLGNEARWRVVTQPLIARADIVFAGDDELRILFGGDPADAAQWLLDAGVRAVVTKHADKSASVTTPDGHWPRSPAVTVPVDVVGAGDALVCGYLGAWLRGEAPERALLSGVLSASLVVSSVGDADGLPTTAELQHALAASRGDGADVNR